MSDIRNKVVSAIQGNAVSPNRPIDGQLYLYNGTTKEFEPVTYLTLASGTTTVQAGTEGTVTLQGTVLSLGFPSQTTAPSAGSADALPAAPAGYLSVSIGGTPGLIPFYPAS